MLLKHLYLTLIFSLFISYTLLAQPSNDECINALPLTDLNNWCSFSGAYSLNGATPSPEAKPFCFPFFGTSHDIWFFFTAQATNLSVSVSGNTGQPSGGSLQFPQIAIYEGNCANLVEIACSSDAVADNTVQSVISQLSVGQVYYIRIDARNSNVGTFQLCVNNFNQIPSSSGDCPTGTILCDKSPFTVEKVFGEGSNPNEIGNSACNSPSCQLEESSSSWYKWTCEDAGTLTFILTPLNPADDLDFILYELPNGIDDCSNKAEIRCMASGENVGQDFNEWEVCTGPTGLATGDTDISETCGCQDGDNNFVDAINMEAGKSYALLVNNFSNSGSGFSVQFGGTGTFLGPTADFSLSPTPVCYGQEIAFTDASFFANGSIVSYDWAFGQGASPSSASGPGPHNVSWNSLGNKSVVLTIETNQGCLVTKVSTLEVEPCCDTYNEIEASAITSELDCPNDESGLINLSATSNAEPLTFSWSNGSITEDLNGLGQGNYSVTITNAASCEEVFEFPINGPSLLQFSPQMVMPTCDGGQDGSLSIFPLGGNGAPYIINWGNNLGSGNFLDSLSIGFYPVTVTDNQGCEKDTIIEVVELVLELDPNISPITEPSCTGFSDGSIQVNISNGLPPYQYNFNNGNGYVSENVLNNIPAGTYIVDVLDANNCEGQFELIVNEPPPLVLDIENNSISCYEAADGSLFANISGGVGGYGYSWNTNEVSPEISNLDIGWYYLTITDANGCIISDSSLMTQPPELFLEVIRTKDVLCHGESNGLISVLATGGTPGYMYSADGQNFQTDTLLSGLSAGDYTVVVEDANGCTAIAEATINQPPPLIIDAGPDQTIQLGFSTDIESQLTPFFWPVTYSWSPDLFIDCLDCPNVTVSPVNTTTYQVTVTDINGCTAIDEITIFLDKLRPVYIPNVFSPDNDGSNDFFTIFANQAAREIKMLRIYSRWGSLVYEGVNIPLNIPSQGWDGTFKGETLDPGVFAYYVEVEFIDGEIVLYEGDVTIIR